MSVKQDRAAPRTAADVDRRYGTKFSEMLGLIDDTRADVEATKTKLSDEIKYSTELSRDTREFAVKIREEMADGISLEVGYTFDANGLNIHKTNDAISTKIDNTGLYVSAPNFTDRHALSANNEGVEAVNLHASTYLTIGDTSRFEDYVYNGTMRTACFWVGG